MAVGIIDYAVFADACSTGGLRTRYQNQEALLNQLGLSDHLTNDAFDKVKVSFHFPAKSIWCSGYRARLFVFDSVRLRLGSNPEECFCQNAKTKKERQRTCICRNDLYVYCQLYFTQYINV